MKTYYTNGHMIVHGDSILGLKSIPDNSVNLIFSDPPYNIGKDFNGIKDNKDTNEYLDWCYEWILECKRVLKSDGTIYLMTSTQNMPYFDIFCREHFTVMSRIIWAYDSSSVQAKKHFGSLYEPIIMLIKDPKNYTFNSDDILVEAKTGSVRRLMDYRKNPPQPYNNKKVPGNVWNFSRVRFRMGEYEEHPTQKPEALLERIILASSNVNDVVLDPFSGTFTTCAVAKRLGRKSIGIELCEDYIKMGLRRVGVESDYHPTELLKIKKGHIVE